MNITYEANGETPEINVDYNNALIITIGGAKHICHRVYNDKPGETWQVLMLSLYAYESIAEITIPAGESLESTLIQGCLDTREMWS